MAAKDYVYGVKGPSRVANQYKWTTAKLKQIIKEEITKVLSEVNPVPTPSDKKIVNSAWDDFWINLPSRPELQADINWKGHPESVKLKYFMSWKEFIEEEIEQKFNKDIYDVYKGFMPKKEPERVAAVSPSISGPAVGPLKGVPEGPTLQEKKKRKKKTKVSKAGQKRVSKKIAILRKKEKMDSKQAAAVAHSMEKSGRLSKHGEYKKKKKKKMKEIYNWQAKANAHKIKVKWINPRKFTGYTAREKLQPLEEAENE